MCPDKKSAGMKCSDKKCASTFSCVMAGIASGVALGVIGKILLDTNKKALKKKADKMLQAIGDLGDSAMDMLR